METAPEKVLFNYLKDIIFKEDAGQPDFSALPDELKELGEGLQLLARWMAEMKMLSTKLSDGYLDTEPLDTENVLISSLKSLQATMKHITWQAQQISKGDYSQKLDFAGEFSDAFNTMTKQLAESREHLEQGRDDAVKMLDLFKRVTDKIDHYMVVVSSVENQELYQNEALLSMKKSNPILIQKLKERILAEMKRSDGILEKWETEIITQDDQSGLPMKWNFLVDVNYMPWNEQPAVTYIIENVTEERRRELEMEGLAFFDALTGLHNRRYIMQVMDQWLQEDQQFCLTFVDLDNLKYANDAFGHNEGDRYIKQTAGLLADVEGDRELARIGGDEFLLMMKNCTRQEMEYILEEKRYNLLHRGVSRGADYRKSFSYGIVDSNDFGSKSKSLMLREADKLMYEYKMLNKPKIKVD